ncbi:methylglyoxal synthase [Alicyclobacillus acidiphilus]|uniref:methylglyoxal synthase n=1 Tax=Alicyclobacillus acidiphilus TaxID=182455 RepID=UPI0008325361|nr:methylglyoxal synthase [Alicyclobacillus acidiphilus]
MNVALIAHDNKKDDIVNLAVAYQNILKTVNLYATGTTGSRIAEATGLTIHRFQSGPYGGDQQIGAMVANDEMDLVIFLRDPLTAQPHDPDITALLRICDVHNVPVASNLATAEALIRAMEQGLINFKPRSN